MIPLTFALDPKEMLKTLLCDMYFRRPSLDQQVSSTVPKIRVNPLLLMSTISFLIKLE